MARFELPVMKTRMRAPATSASSTAYWMSGLSTTGSISLGLALVAGRKRVPRPATGKTAALMRFVSATGQTPAAMPVTAILHEGAARQAGRAAALTGVKKGKKRSSASAGAARTRSKIPTLGMAGSVRGGLRFGARRARALRALRIARLRLVDADVRAILVDHLLADALDVREIVGRAERPVLLAIVDDRLRSRQADAVEFTGERLRIGRVDVDGPRERNERLRQEPDGGDEKTRGERCGFHGVPP